MMYTCTTCQRLVAAKAGDPIHVTSKGKFCTECITAKPPPPPPLPPEKIKPTRSEAQRARWAKMTPEEKTARTAHLRSAREGR